MVNDNRKTEHTTIMVVCAMLALLVCTAMMSGCSQVRAGVATGCAFAETAVGAVCSHANSGLDTVEGLIPDLSGLTGSDGLAGDATGTAE